MVHSRAVTMPGVVSLDDVRDAAERIRGYVVRTPLERSLGLSEHCGVDVWLKFECFQATGAFKLRGALNALLTLEADKVVTASAGNHGLGVARAASLLGVSATVVVPETAPGRSSPPTTTRRSWPAAARLRSRCCRTRHTPKR